MAIMEFRNHKLPDPDLRRKLALSNLDVFHTMEVARTFLSLMNEQISVPEAKVDSGFTDLTRKAIVESIRDISCQYQNHFGGPNCMRTYGLRLVDIDIIRQMLFDYDVYLAEMYRDCLGEVPPGIMECYDWSLGFRRKLTRR